MTNYEFYNGDAEALRKAFEAFCGRNGLCAECQFNEDSKENCMARFICTEHEETKPPKKKRRPYTFEEAKGLLGKVVKGNGESVMITSVHLTCDGVMINGRFQRAFMDMTIDGEPFGVEVEA